ncbi:MAG: hypothetical protein H0T13_07995 [Actinobacteria bacterium]|nr:hypothetical protein [Actinomycetota bacterium]
MREESHIDDMRAALRGDRERAEQARQRSSENVRALVEPVVPPARAPVPAPVPAPEAEPARRGFLGLFKWR